MSATHLFEREDEGLVISEEQPGWKKEKKISFSVILNPHVTNSTLHTAKHAFLT